MPSEDLESESDEKARRNRIRGHAAGRSHKSLRTSARRGLVEDLEQPSKAGFPGSEES